MRYELKSIGLWALIKVSFFLNLVIGFIGGIFNAFFMALILAFSSTLPMTDLGFDPSEFSLSFLFIFLPIIYAIGSAVFLTIFCVFAGLLYNLVAKLLGGYELELTPVEEGVSVQPFGPPVVAPAGPPTPPRAPYKPPPPPPTQPKPDPPPSSGPRGDFPED